MSGPVTSETASLRVLRWRARAPRGLLYATLAVLTMAGLRAAVAAPAEPTSTAPVRAAFDQGAATFAESFARVYLTVDPDRPELREAGLRAYLADTLDPDAGLSAQTRRTVGWTAVVGQQGAGARFTVTVAAEVEGELAHLAVPVARDEHGFLGIPAYPALVGPPASDPDADPEIEEDIADPGLRVVATRAVANYLAGERRNLRADLSPDALVSLPETPLEVRSTDEVTWAQRPRSAAVLVRAEDESGGLWTLRYELEVVRRDRWYVRSLAVDPTQRGDLR